MIEIKRDPNDNSKLCLNLSGVAGAKKNWALTFTVQLSSEFEADITEAALREALSTALQKLRFACYNKGVRDGRGHRPRLNSSQYAPGDHNLGHAMWENVR